MHPDSFQKILLIGNPNVGKSTLFNALCNTRQKTGNYAGVTVSSHSGFYTFEGKTVEVVDLPGTYSLYPTAQDEAISSTYLQEERENYQGVLYVADAQNLRRSLLMLGQLQDMGYPLILILNQMDQARRLGISIDSEELSKMLQIPVLEASARDQEGIKEIQQAIFDNKFSLTTTPFFDIPKENIEFISLLSKRLEGKSHYYHTWFRLASDQVDIQEAAGEVSVDKSRALVPARMQVQETIRRYQSIDRLLSGVIQRKAQFRDLLTARLDRFLVHPFFGYLIFFVVLLMVFQSVFLLADIPMTWIEEGFGWVADYLTKILPTGPLQSLITKGILPGIGGVMVFAPQIAILLYFLHILEDSGYMSRVVFLTDRLLRPFGLNGKSIVPLVSGTACAIPAILSTRSIENVRERLITIIVTPFITCSARLPIYSIIISLVLPKGNVVGIQYSAIALLVMYVIGFSFTLLSAWVLKKILPKGQKTYLVMDLPPYQMPLWINNLRLVGMKIREFITGAGKIIFFISIIIWAFSYFGPSNKSGEIIQAGVPLQESYLAKMGHKIQPVIAPMGYDWKVGVGLMTSFAAREVFVGTISTLYSLDEEAEEGRLLDRMRADRYPDGTPVFSFATGISILLFYAFAMQCISTIAVVYRETQSMKWTIIQAVSMSGLAYLAASLAFQIFK